MTYGGLSPYPRRMGGGKPLLAVLTESLAAARGTAIASSDPTTVAYVEILAIARAIAAAWGTNERLSHQWDALRMTDMLPRWETIFGLTPPPDATIADRRAAVAAAQRRVGQSALHVTVQDALSDALGAVFVAIEFLEPSVASIHVPDGTYPFGTVVDGYPWYSAVAHLLIRVTQPAGYSNADFYAAVGQINEVLDPLLPVYMTFDWYRAPETGAPINVAGGPSAAGFYLDERNLNESVFDV